MLYLEIYVHIHAITITQIRGCEFEGEQRRVWTEKEGREKCCNYNTPKKKK